MGQHVVVDDHSDDQTLAVLEEIDDPRLLVLKSGRRTNQYNCMNIGVARLLADNYEAIAFLDADDIPLPERYEQQLAMLEDCVAVGGATAEIDVHGTPKNAADPTAPAFPVHEDPVPLSLRKLGIGIWSCTMMARAEVFRAIGGFDWTPTMGDTDFSVRLCFWADLEGHRVRNLTAAVNYRRIHDKSVQATVGKPSSPYRVAYTKLLQQRHMFWGMMRRQSRLCREMLYRPLEMP